MSLFRSQSKFKLLIIDFHNLDEIARHVES